ncbi:MAG: response regulator [Pirellulaceae bacterium]|nr:response regulator [Pirellulaceae bacterium]
MTEALVVVELKNCSQKRRPTGQCDRAVWIANWVIFPLLALAGLGSLSARAAEPYQLVEPNKLNEPWRWQSYPNLSGKGVTCLCEGREGSVWFGVSDGLIRFDGLHWTNYTRAQAKLTGPTSFLTAVSNGNIYAGSENELSRFNGESWEPWIAGQPNSNFQIQCVTEASADALVIGTALGPMWLYRDAAVLFTIPKHQQAAEELVSGLGLKSSEVELLPDEIASQLNGHVGIISAVMVQGEGEGEGEGEQRTTWLSIGGEWVLRLDEKPSDGLNGWKLYGQQDGLATRGKARLLVSNNTVWRIAYVVRLVAERYDASTNRWVSTENFESITHRAGSVSLPTQTVDGTIWVGGHRELFALRDGVWTQYDEPSHAIAANDTPLVLGTSRGALWVAGRRQEVNCLDTTSRRWKTFENLNYQCESHDGTKWFVDHEGAVVSERQDQWLKYGIDDGMIQAAAAIIRVKQGGVLVTGSHEGMTACAWFDGTNWHRKQFSDFGAIAEPRALLQAADGTIWIGSHMDEIHEEEFQGWVRVTLPSSVGAEITYARFPPPVLHREVCYGIAQTADGDLWFAGRRMWKYDGIKWTEVTRVPELNSSIKDWLQVMPDGSLWAGSRSFGIFQFNGSSWQQHSTENGLLSNRVVSMASAGPNRIWVATDKDYSIFDGRQWTNSVLPQPLTMSRETGDLRCPGDGSIWINRFPYKWFEATVYGQLSEPSDVPFRTFRFTPDQQGPKTRITLVQDQVAPPGNLLVQWQGGDAERVTEEHQLQYSWRLDDQPWSLFSPETAQVLLSIPSGTHQLQVRARDSDLNVELVPATANFTVLAPVWRQAWFVVTMLGMTAVIAGMLFYLFRLHERYAVDIARAQAEQAEQATAAKLRFFTNISHEFRTPLTLILGPVEKLLGSAKPLQASENRSMLELVRRNAGRLLDLVNQLLDLRKLDAGAMQLQPTQADMVEFVKCEVDAFELMALDKNIDLQFTSNSPYQLSCFDNDKLRKILSNLISNAIKYTPPCGVVTVELLLNSESVEVVVRDTGVGIPTEELPQIWNRFYRAKGDSNATHAGTGVGLALTRELVELHRGQISVESQLGEGTTFRVHLPMLSPDENSEAMPSLPRAVADGLAQPQSDPSLPLPNARESTHATSPASQAGSANDNEDGNEDGDAELSSDAASASEKMTLLIVDDNADIRKLLCDSFADSYRVLEAEDGRQGLHIASEQIPDLIIADVMMPHLLGTDLCRQLKQQKQTSHIPVILLTARSSSDFQLEGLRTGADDYVTKPFSLDHLVARVQNQLESRRALCERMRREFLIEPRQIEVASPEQEFLQQAMSVVETNLKNPQLGVEMLAKELDLSRSHLLRKIKALTDRTTIEFIREVRLKSAARLLVDSTLAIADIIDETGFNDRHHFGRLFRQQFDCNPTEYRQRQQSSSVVPTEE